jgi:hypothetical protein
MGWKGDDKRLCVKMFSRVASKDMPWSMVAETEVTTVSISDNNYISLLGAVLNYFISFKTCPPLPERLLWRTKITAAGSYHTTVTVNSKLPAHIPDMCRKQHN